ncbi:hypothetical protein K439DRAFT_1637982 [Ramaria rubella]|nr:hypothetical protein K439DRAFT_1637982 [Ramaria rubella]
MHNGRCPVLPPGYTYTPYYCEENIYLLADSFHRDNVITQAWEIHVVFVSNERKTVVLWSQSLSREPDHPVVWDYHCILLLRPRSRSVAGAATSSESVWIFDFDSRLAKPCCWSGKSCLFIPLTTMYAF